MKYDLWKEEVIMAMDGMFGLSENDLAPEDLLFSSFESGESPEEYAQRQGEKYDLDRIY